jgi:hypothetical protein
MPSTAFQPSGAALSVLQSGWLTSLVATKACGTTPPHKCHSPEIASEDACRAVSVALGM